MEPLKHECGIAQIVLRQPLEYYTAKYGNEKYALDKLYLLMEKQHNRGQEGAGIACVDPGRRCGEEFMFRERAEGSDAITTVFAAVEAQMAAAADPASVPFLGNVYLGHLRYSTTGRSGLSFVHPFLRRSAYPARNLALCGNFNLTNVDRMLAAMEDEGQHLRDSADTFVILEQIGEALDEAWHRTGNVDLVAVLRKVCPAWDGGFAMCGATGRGETFTLRDPWGIRTAFVYADDEIVAVASERPVLQTVFNLAIGDVRELAPGEAVIVTADHQVKFEKILPPRTLTACSFERIYFSRGSDTDIYRERKMLGRHIAAPLLDTLGGELSRCVFSYIPNTAEVAFLGLTDELETLLDLRKAALITAQGHLTAAELGKILTERVRVEKVAIKDIKLRTFISESDRRGKLAAHVYDVTYGTLRPGEDDLAVIDDSIVRGTTLRESILSILGRLRPRRMFVLSSAPQVRYPDYYGIDMPCLEELVAFRAAISLLHKTGRGEVLADAYERAKAQRPLSDGELRNYVKEIYAPFTDDEISAEIARLLTPREVSCPVRIIFQTLDGLRAACPDHRGDWYFSGDYPTPGGHRMINEAFIQYMETNAHNLQLYAES